MELIRIDSDGERDIPDYSYFVEKGNEFEVIEDQTIDINSIEEIENEVMKDDWRYYVPIFFNKINELVIAVKHLNKEIKSIKEKM